MDNTSLLDVEKVNLNNFTDIPAWARINSIVYYSFIIPIAVFGNIFTLTTVVLVLRVKSSIPNLLIGSLAAIDLLSLLTSHLISIASMGYGSYIGNKGTCNFQSMMTYTYFKFGFLTKCAISLDRFVALAYPLKYSRLITMKRMIAVTISNVVFSFGTSALTLIVDPQFIHMLPTWYMCVDDFQQYSDYMRAVVVFDGTVFTLGGIFFFISNLTVIKVMLELNKNKRKLQETVAKAHHSKHTSNLRKHHLGLRTTDKKEQPLPVDQQDPEAESCISSLTNLSSNGHLNKSSGVFTDKRYIEKEEEKKIQQHQQKELQFAKLVMVIVTVFIILWLPYMTVIYWEHHNRIGINQLLEDVSIKLVFANCCFNPIIYGIFNANFRKAYIYFIKLLRYILTCKLTKKPSDRDLPWQTAPKKFYVTNKVVDGHLITVKQEHKP